MPTSPRPTDPRPSIPEPRPPASRSRRLQDVARPLASPLLGYFDRRFQDLHARFEQRVDQLAAQISTEVECLSEMTLGMQRFVDLCERRVDDAIAAVADLVATVQASAGEESAGPRPDPSLVEVPFAIAAVADAPAPARVLQVGGSSQLALLLAYLGHSVTVVGDDRLAVSHPQLTAVAQGVAEWEGPAEPADVVVCFPLGPAVVERLGSWLDPKGQLVVSALADVDGAEARAIPPGWEVVVRRRYRWSGRRWEPRAEDDRSEGASLVLLRAAPRS